MIQSLNPYSKPLPTISASNRPFWTSTKAHRVQLPRCTDCGCWIYPIAPLCQACWSENVTWQELSGRGVVKSWVVVRRSFDPAFNEDVPYVVAQIELEEGMRFISNVVDVDLDKFYADMPVVAYYEDVTPEITLFKFKRA